MSTWLLPRTELTLDQLNAIDLPWVSHQVIVGAPGSGKTQILLHRADFLRDSMASSCYRIFVYTNVLKDYIRSSLSLLGIPEDAVTTYDSWCKSFYTEYIGGALPKAKGKRPDFERIRDQVNQVVEHGGVRLPLYDFVLVDEAQDLDSASLRTLAKVARHVTLCLDRKQQIYERGSSLEQAVAAMGARPRNAYLLDAYRCSPSVATLASYFVADDQERTHYMNQVRTLEVERQVPLLFRAKDAQDERTRLRRILRERIDLGHRSALLFPLRRQVYGFAKGLREAGFDVETMKDLDFSSNRPKVLTYSSAKGLTFDSVLLPRITSKSFGRWTDTNIRRLLFVAISRAKDWVYLSTVVNREAKALRDVYTLAGQGGLTIQAEWTGPQRSSEAGNEGDNDDVLDLL